MRVRVATPADIPAIQKLEKQADTAAHWSGGIYHGLFAAASVERISLVADDNAGISAFIVARTVGDEWEIENVVVEMSRRRRGIASALMDDLMERARARGVARVLLEVRHSNTSARELYIKVGFVECGRRARYYQNPEEDAICYRLEVRYGHGKSP